MELTQQQEASSSSTFQPILQSSSSASASTTSEPRALRSSARVKAAKEKEKGKEREVGDQPPQDSSRISRTPSQSNPGKRARVTSTSKGKAKDTTEETSARPNKRFVDPDNTPLAVLTSLDRARRATHPITSTALTIQEPLRDPKGKKRALPESNSDEETPTASSSTNKRTRTTSAYSLRSRTDLTLSEPLEMPKKTR
jgi:E3 ubiquitin-protein ligase TRIP12